nr:T9SS type A sorting domain-containing protein [Gammaproteobacteria bacterium]NIW46519.1 T9SS type A sorting domain-containing protein [Gammaproteobacteria bacterium]NIW97860.1 T9SS type A sorting domain-containing protein [Phycisphaerae bacterium]
NANTMISYQLSAPAKVRLTIYDVLGKPVVTLVDRYQKAGKHSISWDGKTGDGESVATGLYFYHLKAGGVVQTRKMLLLR